MYRECMCKRLQEIRIQKGYTQKEIEKETGIPQPILSRIEKGAREPNIENLGTLIDFYEVSANWILGTGKKTE